MTLSPYVQHNPFPCVTELILACDKTHIRGASIRGKELKGPMTYTNESCTYTNESCTHTNEFYNISLSSHDLYK